MANSFALNVFVNPSDADLSPVPLFAALQYSLSQNGGGPFYVSPYNPQYSIRLTGYTVQMLIDSPSAPPGFLPPGGSNVFQVKLPMTIYSASQAYIPSFSAFQTPGVYTLNFLFFGTPNFVAQPTVLGVTV